MRLRVLHLSYDASRFNKSVIAERVKLEILEFIKNGNSVCVGDTVNKHGAGRRHDYLYVHSPGGAFNVILFRRAVIV